MGKVLVLYDSASGNTAKMAALVAEGAGSIPGIEVRLRKVDEATRRRRALVRRAGAGQPDQHGPACPGR